MSVGKNTVSGEQLRSFVERIEKINADIKELQDERSAVKAEAKMNGFNTIIIGNVVRRRAAKPHDLQEHDALMDLYQHALGMLPEPPLFRAVGLAANDELTRETVIEQMKKLVPAGGEIVVKIGKPMRIWRDKEGEAHAEEVIDKPKPAASAASSPMKGERQRAPVPDVDDAGAFALGCEAAKGNKPVIDNPFPYGDARRAKWDEGWRKETGSDGMGLDD